MRYEHLGRCKVAKHSVDSPPPNRHLIHSTPSSARPWAKGFENWKSSAYFPKNKLNHVRRNGWLQWGLAQDRDAPVQLCVNPKTLNAVTVRHSDQSIQNVECTDRLRSSTVFIFLRASMSHWQVEVKDEDQVKMPVISPHGVLNVSSMPSYWIKILVHSNDLKRSCFWWVETCTGLPSWRFRHFNKLLRAHPPCFIHSESLMRLWHCSKTSDMWFLFKLEQSLIHVMQQKKPKIASHTSDAISDLCLQKTVKKPRYVLVYVMCPRDWSPAPPVLQHDWSKGFWKRY